MESVKNSKLMVKFTKQPIQDICLVVYVFMHMNLCYLGIKVFQFFLVLQTYQSGVC